MKSEANGVKNAQKNPSMLDSYRALISRMASCLSKIRFCRMQVKKKAGASPRPELEEASILRINAGSTIALFLNRDEKFRHVSRLSGVLGTLFILSPAHQLPEPLRHRMAWCCRRQCAAGHQVVCRR